MADASGPSITEPDWSRERRRRGEWSPGKGLLASIRAYQNASGPLRMVTCRLAVLRHRFWSAVSGADIPLTANIGGGLIIPHPNGIVIHPKAVIGPNCLFFQQVTVGDGEGLPTIEGGVDIGAGAKVLGPITIGARAIIGANAVVLIDVPANRTAVGIPARLLPR